MISLLLKRCFCMHFILLLFAHLSRRLLIIAYRIGVLWQNKSVHFSSPESKAHKVSLQDGTRAGVRACLRASVRLFTLSNMNISETSGPIAIKLNLKHVPGWGKSCIRFWARSDQNSGLNGNGQLPQGYNVKNLVSTLAPSFLIGSSSYLQVTRKTIISRTSSNFGQIRLRTAELAALEHPRKFPQTYNGRNVVSTLSSSFLIGSSSFLQVMRTIIKAWINSNFSPIRLRTAE